MIKGICFIQTENSILYPANGEYKDEKLEIADVIVKESIILDLISNEFDEVSHEDILEEDATLEEMINYYTENVIRDGYTEYIAGLLDTLDLRQESLDIIQEIVKEEIIRQVKNKYEDSLILSGIKESVLDIINDKVGKDYNKKVYIELELTGREADVFNSSEFSKEIDYDIEDNKLLMDISKSEWLGYKPTIKYIETKVFNKNSDLYIEMEKAKKFTQQQAKLQGIDIKDAESNIKMSNISELFKAVTYTVYKNKVFTKDVIYKRNRNGTISVFELIEE